MIEIYYLLAFISTLALIFALYQNFKKHQLH